MTSPDLLEEAEEASIAFQVALARIGAESIVDALRIWRRMNPADAAGTAADWLDDAVQMILSRREHSRDLGLAYYRLARALITGSTVPDPRRPEPTYVTLEDLRREFADLAGASGASGGGNLSVPIEPHDVPVSPRDQEGVMERDDSGAELVDMTVDELREALRADIERTEADRLEADEAAEEEARLVLEALGKEGLLKRIRGLDEDAPAKEVDAARADAAKKAGSRQSSAAARIVQNGARGEVWGNSQRDGRVLAWARKSRTGTPCGFCAMLISRGAVYRSAGTAEIRASDMDLYHDDCNCYAEPLFTDAQYDDSAFDLNRLYEEWWPEVTRGTSGKYAVALWRKFHRLKQAEGWSDSEALAKWNEWFDYSTASDAFTDALDRRLARAG